jgi:outer membrane receptor protein involved in Fe transport
MTRKILFSATSVLALLAVAGTASAQPATGAAAPEAKETVEKVVVTTQRRSQRLLEVPASVTAVTAAEIEARNVESLQDMQSAVPGLAISQSSAGFERVELRGIAQQAGAPTVGLYLDEMSIAPRGVAAGPSIRIFDLERIEIARGPQPTLYGEGSMGGTIRYITAAPNLTDIEGRAKAQVGFIEDGDISQVYQGALSVPLVKDQLAIRAAAQFEDTGGFIDTPRGKDRNGVEFSTFRAKALFQPSDQFSGSLLWVYQDMDQAEKDYGTNARVYLDATGFGEATSDEQSIGNLVLNYDAGAVTVTGSSGYFSRQTTTDDFFGVFAFGSRTFGESTRTTQELRVTSNSEGPFRYLAGLTYTDYEETRKSADVVLTIPPTPALGRPDDFDSRMWAFYAEAGYDFGKVELTVGGRYFEDDQTRVLRSPFASPTERSDTQKFSSFNPRINLSYTLDNGGLLYANAAKGFRTGGFNNPSLVPVGGAIDFNPEGLWSYEIGTKQKLLDGKLIVDASVYRNEWSDVQIPVPGTSLFQGYTINGGKASGWGADLALTGRANEYLSLTGTLSWTDMQYDTASINNLPGDPLDLVPAWTASISADYRRPIGDNMEFFGRVDYGYKGEVQSTLRSLTPILGFFPPGTVVDIAVIPGHENVNARFGIDIAGVANGPLTIYLFGQNLTDDDTPVYAAGTVVPAKGPRPRPRTIGIGASVAF